MVVLVVQMEKIRNPQREGGKFSRSETSKLKGASLISNELALSLFLFIFDRPATLKLE